MAIKLLKYYDDKKKAGQTGKFNLLIFQVIGTPEKMDGIWGYAGFENSE